MFQVARDLRRLFKDDEVDPRPFLRKFWGVACRLLSMPECMVSRVLFFERRDSLPRGEDGRSDGQEARGRRRLPGVALGEKGAKKKQAPGGAKRG